MDEDKIEGLLNRMNSLNERDAKAVYEEFVKEKNDSNNSSEDGSRTLSFTQDDSTEFADERVSDKPLDDIFKDNDSINSNLNRWNPNERMAIDMFRDDICKDAREKRNIFGS